MVHGFNTHRIGSVIRWAAMIYKNGYNVLAADQRDYDFEYPAGYGYPNFPQTFGWKEAQDVVAAGRYLRQQKGVATVGVSASARAHKIRCWRWRRRAIRSSLPG